MSEYPPEIVKAIAAVMASVPYVQKTGRNQHGNYNYASESDVLESLRPALIEHGLVLMPSVTEQISREHPREKGGFNFYVDVVVEVTLAHTSGAVWPVPLIFRGCGMDTQDKATAKAVTSALKYGMLKLFQIETGDDPDKDAGVAVKPEKPQTLPAPQAAQKNAPTSSPGPQNGAPDDRPPQIEESTVDLWVGLVKKAPTSLDLTAIADRMKVDLGRMTPEQKAKIKAAGTKRRAELTDSPGGVLAPPVAGPLPAADAPPGSSTDGPKQPTGRMPLDAAAVLDSMQASFKAGFGDVWLAESGAHIADIKSGAWRDYVHALYKHEQGSR